LPVTFVLNPDFVSGIASSLAVGLTATPAEADGAVVLLGDMPKVEARLIDALIAAFEAKPDARAVAPVQNGRRGNPVLISRSLFDRVRRLEGDEGARRLIATLDKRDIVEIDAEDWDATFDVDTPTDLAAAIQAGQESTGG
ncbi:MAG: nucleotidyltransferase family protein, partial [Hyphomicrobiales bacterium]|nr:nucleotidyltransferase family protein [Hyphomicrobiales bacterium]